MNQIIYIIRSHPQNCKTATVVKSASARGIPNLSFTKRGWKCSTEYLWVEGGLHMIHHCAQTARSGFHHGHVARSLLSVVLTDQELQYSASSAESYTILSQIVETWDVH